ncbi:MAG: HAD-IIIC family phosphatase [Candidatus Taylorbacteria bacterium]|nr:HAD-IIIC family phosphatase [Candidatus Taylorbacteria bacterium]
MKPLDYFKIAGTYEALNKDSFKHKVKINLCTNFTDEIIYKLLSGYLISEKIYPEIFKVPYKQYPAFLKNENSALFSNDADISFIFFDINQYLQSELSSDTGGEFFEIIKDIQNYVKKQKGLVIMNSIILPYHSAYANIISENKFFKLIQSFNSALEKIKNEEKSFYIFDTNRIMHILGENASRDLRGMYAFDNPFTSEFQLEIVRQWTNFILAKLGKTKKCIVLDLDNVLWGGVLGESGVHGIHLGPGYPGLAYQNFQLALLDYYNRGVLLAINSRNNESDVNEVFEKNKHMILKPHHFASAKIN